MTRARPRLAAPLSAALLAAATVAVPEVALAEPPEAGSDPASAQALFYEGRALAREGRYALACAKFEESLRLDYGIGTEFNLADCNERLGKIATAWSRFINVAAASRERGQSQREKIARERAKALEERLPKLTIEVAAPATPNLEVKRDGVVMGSASWGAAIPLDPGPHRITASAPGHVTWEGVVNAVEGNVVEVTIPCLATAPVVAPTASVVASEAAPAVRPPEPFPEPLIERGSGQRTAGWLIAAAGLAGIGVGAGFGFDSLQKRERAKPHCRAEVCDPRGVELRDRAIESGDVATIATIAGGAALIGGLVLVLTAPSSAPPKETAQTPSFRAYPHVSANGGGLSFQGALP
jgi:hypothetical protein